MSDFQVGQIVKMKGTYSRFLTRVTIRSVFYNNNGRTRIVVEHSGGVLNIVQPYMIERVWM